EVRERAGKGGTRERPGPLGPGKSAHVGDTGAEVVPPALGAGLPDGLRRLHGSRAHVGTGAGPRLEVALGDELGVGVEDDVAGDLELPGQRSTRGKALPLAEAAGSDRVAKGDLELTTHAPGVALEGREEEVRRRSGSRGRHAR